jgi:hypothetical protein
MPASSDLPSENDLSSDEVSPYLLIEPRILREACQTMRRDDGGRRCPKCCVREFCETQARRAGKLDEAGRGVPPRPVRRGRGSA